MSSIDIRNGDLDELSKIVFADSQAATVATFLERESRGLSINESCEDAEWVIVNNLVDAQNLIKAINHAIELGWFR